jgi:hypothetical protein
VKNISTKKKKRKKERKIKKLPPSYAPHSLANKKMKAETVSN